AKVMGKSEGDLIFVLLKNGMACNRNYVLPVDIIKSLGMNFGIQVEVLEQEESVDKFLSASAKGVSRWPIVVVMGHVDHGKTTLLDFLRRKNTVAKEKGGITQHLGAYEVDSKHGKIVFLDTPGHEAFSYLRSRGARVTDIAVLIIAAEDGVKPQTVEAIKHAKKSDVPLIVAINKIDKITEDKRPAVLQTIYRELAENDVLVEDWGGEIISVPISAKTGTGVDELLEMIVLQSEMMDLKSDPKVPAKAFVLESNLEKGLGPVATVVCLEGTLKKGDYFVCGNVTGKVRLLINSLGKRINEAGPSVPVKVVGFDSFAEIGGWLTVVSAQEYKKAKTSKKAPSTPSGVSVSPASIEQGQGQINLIIKTDTRGSKEAIEGSLLKLDKLTQKGCAKLNVVLSGIGDVSENDVDLASITNSLVISLHTRVEKKAQSLAQEKDVKIKSFDVIYHLVEYLEEELKKTKKVEIKWKKVAQLLVKRVFKIKKFGVIAGCSVQEGTVAKGNKVVCVRGGHKIGEGLITSLQREKKTVKEVHAGYECGFISDGFQDWEESDIVHVFAPEKVVESD
ncbi:translation initiation factor IF-2, partial [Candidatus Dependentiae bacterium]|nr:translation initiation factor IF-2 [Candidatus Dependentiae bacterium]